MFINRKNWLIGAAAASVIATSAAAWAMGPGGGGDHDPGRMLAHMADKLDLSAEQEASAQQLLAATREAIAADRQRLRVLRKEMMAMKGNFDSAQAQGIADEIGQITTRMVFETSKTWSGVYQLLDAEQREELDALMAKREARRGKWHKGGGESQ